MAGNALRSQPYQRIATGDPAADSVAEESARQSRKLLNDNPALAGRELGPITLATGADTEIQHKLGRTLQRWTLTDCTGGPPLVYRTNTTRLETVLVLHNSHTADLSVCLRVY